MTLQPRRQARERLLSKLHREGWLRRKDLITEGIHPRWLRQLQEAGSIARARAGLYRVADAPETTNQTLYDACTAVPDGVVCLVSALAYHGLTTANPSAVDIAVPRDHWQPRIVYPPVRFYEFRPRLIRLGLQRIRGRRGQELRVFDRERSICDAFRLRRIVGKDAALEALQIYLRSRRDRDIDTLFKMARETRVSRLIRPYVEALT
jgi:predicted transcriptional regulator of viral defense system